MELLLRLRRFRLERGSNSVFKVVDILHRNFYQEGAVNIYSRDLPRHRRRKVYNIGGQGLEYWGATGGPNSQQAFDVAMTSTSH